MTSLQSSTRSLLLRSMDPADFALIETGLERAEFGMGDVLHGPGQPIDRVHFVEQGVVSVVDEQESGQQVELGLVGYEGLTGLTAILAVPTSPHRYMVQGSGCSTLHIAADRLLETCRANSGLQSVLLRYGHIQTVQLASTASSNALLTLPERLARWLLMVHDRVDGDRLELTHEFMATMLAVRRSGVTVTLHQLEEAGAIQGRRGTVIVTDRARLRELAGEGYGAAEREYCALIAPFGRS